jgi:Fe-S cluster assembly ATP-binding protein
MDNNSNTILEIKNLSVSVNDDLSKENLSFENLDKKVESKEILKGLDLKINKGEVHVLMGTNGSGKSTLANALMGHPNYNIEGGEVNFLGENLLEMEPEEKARKGLFLAFQYPKGISGLSVGSFLRAIVNSVNDKEISIREFRKMLNENMNELGISREFLSRSLNEGFSGGEKKRHEILQMNLLKPKLAILDETDSGLDVDALKVVFGNITKNHNNERALLIITHYSRILKYLNPTHVHVMSDGVIVKSGGVELSELIEEKGFETVINS